MKKLTCRFRSFCVLTVVLAFAVLADPAIGASGPLLAPAATPNSVTLTWTAPGDDSTVGTATQYDIRYSLSTITDANWSSATQVTGESTPKAAGSAESFEVTGLQPSTTYYFAIKAADEALNWSVLSNVVSKSTTPENTPPFAIANLTTENPTTNSISLRWTSPGDDGGSGTASQYDIRYSTSTITDANWNSAIQASGEPSPKTAGSTETFTVGSLNASTTYYFAIKTADEVPNWSTLSNVANGTTQANPTTPPAPVLASPADGAVDLAQPVALDWSDVAGVDLYEVQLDTLSTFGAPVKDTSPAVSNYSANGLSQGDTYYWRVRAHNSVGWGNWSTSRNFTTICPVPAVPVLASPNNGATNLNQPITLDWQDVSGAVQYQVQVDDAAAFSAPEVDITTSGSTYNVSGLDDGITFNWRVRANNACGWGSWSVTRTFVTRDTTIPAAIANLNAAPGTNNGEVLLTWTATGDDGNVGTASQYDIRYSITSITAQNWSNASQVSNEPSPKVAGSAESFTVGSLDPNIRYYFAIRATDESGNISALSNVVNATPRDLTPPAAINDLSAVTGASEGEIGLMWTAPGIGDDGGIISSYLLKYSTEMMAEADWETATTYQAAITPRPAGQSQDLVMTGLVPGQRYYLGMKSFGGDSSVSPLSNIASAVAMTNFALEDGDSVVPVGPSPNAVLHSSRPTLAVANIDTTGDNSYFFEVAADSFFTDAVAISPPVPQAGGDNTSWRIETRLDAGKYFWRAKANSNPYCAPSAFILKPETHAYPNPFKMGQVPVVTFTDIPSGSDLIVMSVSGSTIREWVNVAGNELTWDGTNQSGDAVASGTYLWSVEGWDINGKIIVIK